jgi:O-antigen/teichoic acid export membrane protein
VSSVRRSIAFSALDSYLALVLQIASTVIVARILTPEQTGIFAVAAVFASLASTFRDFGVAEYLIQEKELTHDAIRAALTVNIGVSWLMAALLYLGAPWAADFYRAAGVQEVMQVQAISFLLIPFGAVTMAWFRREMNFKPMMVAGILGNSISFVVVLTLALNGFGYMSLAWSSVAGVVVTVLVAMVLRPAEFPRWPGLKGVAKVFHFGKFASGIYIFGQLGKGAPEMLIGRAQDMAAVGMFSRAQGLVEIFNRLVLRAIMPVYLPFFAKAVRDTGSPKPGLLQAMAYLTAVGWPFLAFVGIASFSVIRLMYGLQWLEAVPLARLLCAVAAVELVYVASKECLLAKGLAKESHVLQVLTQLLRVVGLMAVFPWGLAGACWGLLAAGLLGAVVSHVFLARHVDIQVLDVARAVWPSAKVCAIALAPLALWALCMPIDESNYLGVVVIAGALSTVLWLASLRWVGHPLWPEVVRLAPRFSR